MPASHSSVNLNSDWFLLRKHTISSPQPHLLLLAPCMLTFLCKVEIVLIKPLPWQEASLACRSMRTSSTLPPSPQHQAQFQVRQLPTPGQLKAHQSKTMLQKSSSNHSLVHDSRKSPARQDMDYSRVNWISSEQPLYDFNLPNDHNWQPRRPKLEPLQANSRLPLH